MRLSLCALTIFVAIGAFCSSATGQQDPNDEIGLNPFKSYDAGNIDTVSLSNGSLTADIPLISYPQRGGKLKLPFTLHFYNGSAGNTDQCYIFYGEQVCVYTLNYMPVKFALEDLGVVFTQGPPGSNADQGSFVGTNDGANHLMGGIIGKTNLLETVDSTGYQVAFNPNATGSSLFTTITDREGTVYQSDSESCINVAYQPYVCNVSREDVNGNQITFSATGGWTDTMGRVIPLPTTSTNQSDFSGCTGSGTITSVQLWSPPGINGGTYPLKICYTSINYPGTAPGTNFSMVQSVLLPDGTSWIFSYSPRVVGQVGTCPGTCEEAELPTLSEITFPTGGSISYTWMQAGTGCVTSNNDSFAVATRTFNDGAGPSETWTYTYQGAGAATYVVGSGVQTRIITDPAGNDSVHTFGLGGCYMYETQTQQYQGSHTSGALLKTVTTIYSYTLPSQSQLYPYGKTAMLSVVPTQKNTTWANGQQSQIQYAYDGGFQYEGWNAGTSGMSLSGSPSYTGTFGKQLTKEEYDYGNGAPGSLLRTTNTNYLALSNSNYENANIIDPVSSVQVLDGGGTQRSYTTYGYDEGETGYHGNPTSTHRWLNTTGTYLVTSNVYNLNGLMTSSTDPKGNVTTYSYTSPCYAGSGPTSVTNALLQTTNNCYDSNSGLRTSTTDPNNQTTSYVYDDMLRTTQINHPDGGLTTFTYPDAADVDITEKVTSAMSRVSYLKVDGLGREIRRAVTNGETTPYDEADTCYDSLGHVSFKSYPFQDSGPFGTTRSCGSPESGDSFLYDALSRPTSTTHSDGTAVTTSYGGRATNVLDEGNGTQSVQRISQVDGLGHLTSVCEVTSSTLAVGISGSTTPTACGQDIAASGFLTTYSYDVNDNLTSVAQGPLSGRSFAYDSLSRLTSSTNPESGTTTYTYDSDGNVSTRIDARGITTCFGTWTGSSCNTSTGYDALNRLLVKTYSDGTTQANFQYDAASAWGDTLSNTIGRLSEEWTSTSTSDPTATIFSYDPMGRVQWEIVCTPSYCPNTTGNRYGLSYAYDLIGDVTYSTNGAQVALTYAYNAGGRLTSITSSLSDANHPPVLWGKTNPVHYNAAGGVVSATFGNGIGETRTYDGRQRLTGISDGSVYTLTIPTNGYAPDSDILAANDSVNTNWRYAYDAFNRLVSANASGQAYTYAYDRYGNRWQQNGPHQYQASFTGNNRVASGTGVAYDAAGDTTNDGTTTYTYDAEGRVITAYNATNGTSTYIYDAEGRRAEKTTVAGSTVDFLYDPVGQEVSQMSSSAAWTRGEVYAGSRHVATYTGASGTTYFIHSDWLGTERARSAVNGTSTETCTSLAFGDWLTCSGSDVSPLHFTGKEHDSETGLENFKARYNSSSMGRFMSADPKGFSNKMLANPQDLNLYLYTINNPLRYSDPNGKDWKDAVVAAWNTLSVKVSVGIGAAAEGEAAGLGLGAHAGAKLELGFDRNQHEISASAVRGIDGKLGPVSLGAEGNTRLVTYHTDSKQFSGMQAEEKTSTFGAGKMGTEQGSSEFKVGGETNIWAGEVPTPFTVGAEVSVDAAKVTNAFWKDNTPPPAPPQPPSPPADQASQSRCAAAGAGQSPTMCSN